MNWSILHEKFIDINPNRRYYCDLCHISSPKDSLGSEVLHFVLDLNEILFAQPSSFPAGKYEMQFGLYSENAGHQEIYFEVSWSGKWNENEGEMFKEMVIRRKVVD